MEEERRYWSAEGNTSCKKKALLMKRGGKAFSRGSDFFFCFSEDLSRLSHRAGWRCIGWGLVVLMRAFCSFSLVHALVFTIGAEAKRVDEEAGSGWKTKWERVVCVYRMGT